MKLTHQLTVVTPGNAIDILAAAVPQLPKARLKDAMLKGAVQQLSKPVKRLRRAQTPLAAGTRLALHYDAALLQRQCLPATLVHDEKAYSVWFKPAGMLSQGNEWGDHLSLLRFVEQTLMPARSVFLLHRLDREASGLLLVAHTKKAAAALSRLIAERQITKIYWIQVRGQLSQDLQQQGLIAQPLDGKVAKTEFKVLGYDAEQDVSELQVRLISGRKHQIRRHFAAVGHPVMGDPQYGKHNKNHQGLALQAVALEFTCPLSRRHQHFTLPTALHWPTSCLLHAASAVS